MLLLVSVVLETFCPVCSSVRQLAELQKRLLDARNTMQTQFVTVHLHDPDVAATVYNSSLSLSLSLSHYLLVSRFTGVHFNMNVHVLNTL